MYLISRFYSNRKNVLADLNRRRTCWWLNTHGIIWKNICHTISEKSILTTRKSYRFLVIREDIERLQNHARCGSVSLVSVYTYAIFRSYILHDACHFGAVPVEGLIVNCCPSFYISIHLYFCLSHACLPLIWGLDSPTLTLLLLSRVTHRPVLRPKGWR